MNTNNLAIFLTMGAGIGCAIGAILGIFIGNITLGVVIGIPIFSALALLSANYFIDDSKDVKK